jgi:chromosome segregation ATPase
MNMDNSFETKILERKTEKLAFSLVVISVLIPAVIIAIGFFGYAELKNSIKELNSNKEKSLTKLSSEFKDTIFKNASKTEKIESHIKDFEDKITNYSNGIDILKKKIEILSSSCDELEKKLNSELQISNKNKTTIISISKNLAHLQKDHNNILGNVNTNKENIEKSLKIIENFKEQNDLKKIMDQKINAINAKMLEISKATDFLNKEVSNLKNNNLISELKKELENINKEIKKREVEERITNKRINDIENFLKSNNSENSIFQEKNLLEQDLKD